jgi:hypothetical protein
VRAKDGKWHALTRAHFTADNNPVLTIDAGVDDGRFFLTTGGKTENTHVKLNDSMNLPERQRTPPTGLPLADERGKGR